MRPVMLDESTTALDLTNKAHFYSLLCESSAAVVSIGNRTSLLQFLEQLLVLKSG